MRVVLLIACCLALLNACALMKEQKKFDARETGTSTNASFTQTKRQDPIRSEWLKPSPKPYALGPGDKLEIEIIGETIATDVSDATGRAEVKANPFAVQSHR